MKTRRPNMKNTTFFTIGVLVLTIALFTACPPEPEPAHVHQWGAWNVTAAANCTTPGSQTRTCELDATHTDTQTIPIDPTAHNWDNHYTVTTPATCSATGIETDTCSYNATHTRTQIVAIDPTAHDYQWVVTTPSTCTTEGVETGTCSHNPTHTTTRPKAIDPNAHDWGIWENLSNGVLTRICSHNSSHTEASNEMVFVPGGTFQLGKDLGTAATGDVTPVSNVTLSGFYIGKYEVTQSQWQAVMGATIQELQTAADYGSTNYGRGDSYPVYCVSSYDAIVFCNKLSIAEGLTPAYRISNSTNPDDWGTVPTYSNATWDAATVDSNANGYRLPTEAQWEYAAKGGNTGGTFTYAGSDNPDEVAWYNGNSGSAAHAVGTKAPNGLGLYDMSGNVREWCWDWIGDYTSEDKTDPTGASSGSSRVIRGGNWNNSAEIVRSAYRSYVNPNYRYFNFGFRLLRP